MGGFSCELEECRDFESHWRLKEKKTAAAGCGRRLCLDDDGDEPSSLLCPVLSGLRSGFAHDG